MFSPTVREEVAFGCLQKRMTQEETLTRAAAVLAMLGISELADRAPFQLSGGQKKKIAIASVLVTNPDVLLFDEPTAALDPRTQQWLTELIVELNESGKTNVLATHDFAALNVLADRALAFAENHTIIQTGTAVEVLAAWDLPLSVTLIHERSRIRGN